MYIVKNRITGEYDRRGSTDTFSKVKRGAWDKISHVKCHVINVLLSYYFVDNKAFDWYMNADFIEINENGIGKIIPVRDYLRDYFKDSGKIEYLTVEQRECLGLGRD